MYGRRRFTNLSMRYTEILCGYAGAANEGLWTPLTTLGGHSYSAYDVVESCGQPCRNQERCLCEGV